MKKVIKLLLMLNLIKVIYLKEFLFFFKMNGLKFINLVLMKKLKKKIILILEQILFVFLKMIALKLKMLLQNILLDLFI